ncbi:MAG: guanylate kinase [Immundisolibacter sp.]|uniref:guanylate kinase n=1 Tax=Immundisolibacter sp. TaxID=1934948 RepID=UPI003D0EE710
MPDNAGLLFVVCGPSGVGKTSLVRALVARCPALTLSVSYTTRAPRPGEQDGVAYHFVSAERFAAMQAAGEFLESARVFDHHYGTAAPAVAQTLAAGHSVVLEIDWQGARQAREKLPGCVTVMVLPPSVATLRARLGGRGDDEAIIERRMRDALAELGHWPEFDYLVVNDEFERALDDLVAVTQAATLTRDHQRHWLVANLPELVAP